MRPYEHPCRPPLWARGGHLQTVLGHLIPTPAPKLVAGVDGVTAHDVPLDDGDRLRVFVRPGRTDVVVHLFHGLSGDANVDYMRIAAEAAVALGHGVISVNHRGCGDGRGMATGIYHSGRDRDVSNVTAWARRRHPSYRHIAVGISLSGNALLLLAGKRELPGPDALIAINPPVDLAKCAVRITQGFNRVYDRRFVRRCTEQLAERKHDGLLANDFAIERVANIREFDERYTAPLGGFANATEYYEVCSARPWLSGVRTPAVILTSTDDPFVSASDVIDTDRSDAIHLHVERHGGHAAYLEAGGVGRPGRWLGGALQHYLSQL